MSQLIEQCRSQCRRSAGRYFLCNLSGIYYRNTSDVIQRLTTINESGMILIMPHNLARQHSYGFEFNLTYNFLPWLKFNNGLNIFRAQTSGVFEGLDLSSDTYTWTNRSALNGTISGKWKAQAAFNYTAPRINTQGKQLSSYFMDIGLGRELFKGNATLTFNVRDIFNTRRWRSITHTPNLYAESNTQWRPRSFQLSINYRFNQKPGQEKNTDFNNDTS